MKLLLIGSNAVAAEAGDGKNAGISEDEEESKNGVKKTVVVVGIKRDGASKELLTWALVKVAGAGDRVVAVHVSSAGAVDGVECEEKTKKVADELMSVLAVYDGFCNLKQIDLELKVCSGSSIKNTLIKEANSYGAAKLILGISKDSRAFGSSAAVAKYCAKRLSRNCSVLAVNNGKVVFQRDAMEDCNLPTVLGTSRRSYRKFLSAKLISGEKDRHASLMANNSFARSVSLPSTSSSPSSVKEETLALVPVKNPIRKLPEAAMGWPLLRNKFLVDQKAYLPARSKISVVQWALQLPSRVSPVHPDYKSITNGANLPSGSNSGNQSPLIEELDMEIPEELVLLKEKYSSTYTSFSYEEIVQITCNFSPGQIIGKGGTSSVYKGCIPNGRELAVKILKSSEEILKEFVSEIEIISSLDNENIISLVGFCFKGENLILVYDYLPRGSLEEVLHGDKGKKDAFGWMERYKVALGVARALDYLHGNGNDRPVIHRDVKSSNILISGDFEPKLSDFGLALWESNVTSQITCNDVAGTFGYLAPEYFMYGKVNDKIDVYAFGVVLLELISGRKPLCTGCTKGHESLVMWADSIIQGGKLMELVDPGLPTQCNDDQIDRMILAATLCIRRAPQSRPKIALILKLLDGDEDVLKWARSQVGLSQESNEAEDEVVTAPTNNNNIQSYINLALLDDDALSVGSTDFITSNTSLEEYLRGRWSRSSSFD